MLKGMAAGEVILVECTDPLSAIDIPNLVNQTGDVLEGTERADEILRFRIRKA
ncbi:MAG: sulfurtransferase TusA family protein [Pseudorhodoplanes sp.]